MACADAFRVPVWEKRTGVTSNAGPDPACGAAPNARIEEHRVLQPEKLATNPDRLLVAPVLAFDATVRGSQTVQVPITNTSTSTWQLHPVISDGAWSAPDLEVPAGATCNLAVVYAPLTTAADLHRGTLFMALPTGSALSYRLQGRTQAPALESDGACQVRAKCASTHTLPVRNWLHDPQRFRIDIQRESPPDDTVSITAGDSVGVPGGVSRDVRLQIYAYRPGTTVALVKFVNDDNGEYLVHRLTIVVTDAGIIDRIALQSPVRQRALTSVPLENRLGRDCTLTSFSCESPDVDVRGLPVRLTARRETLVSIAYRPLVVGRPAAGPQRVRLTLSSAELGDFPYELELQACAAAVDASLRFDAYLGATCTQRFRFLSWSKKPTTYECSFVGGQAFQVVGDKKVTCAGADANGDTGVECQVTVLFDPSGLNDVRDELKVTSTDAGEYRCALHGHCSVPRPEGPISITAGASQAVRFRNVFGQRSEFVYTVDNPAFTIGKKGETVDTKKEVSIQVGFQWPSPRTASWSLHARAAPTRPLYRPGSTTSTGNPRNKPRPVHLEEIQLYVSWCQGTQQGDNGAWYTSSASITRQFITVRMPAMWFRLRSCDLQAGRCSVSPLLRGGTPARDARLVRPLSSLSCASVTLKNNVFQATSSPAAQLPGPSSLNMCPKSFRSRLMTPVGQHVALQERQRRV